MAPPLRQTADRLLALVIAVALVTATCDTATPTTTPRVTPATAPTVTAAATPTPASTRSPNPTAAPSVDETAVYAAIEAQVMEIRELRARSSVDPKVIDSTALRDIVSRSFREDNPPAVVAANERLLKGLRLLPEDASLADLFVELLASQVAGLYRPDTKELYVVSRKGGLGPVERVTFAHEFTHALQDQAFGLATFGVDEIGQGDRSLARLAFVEGDATLVMFTWSQANLSSSETLELLAASVDPEQLQLLASMPAILRETLLFPYQDGFQFVTRIQAAEGWAGVNRAFGDPPDSTEQILHPEAWSDREEPRVLDIPAGLAASMGAGWSVGMEDTLGELQLRVWLREVGAVDVEVAIEQAAGWGGDRVVLLDGPAHRWAIALLSEWDTPADAQEFADAVDAMRGFALAPSVVHGPGETRVDLIIGSDSGAEAALAAALGHPGD